MARVEREIVVQAPPDTVYQVWHNFENFPGFMRNVEEVRPMGAGRFHWRAHGAPGFDAEWDAEITRDEPGRMIAWRSIDSPESSLETEGIVRFEGVGGGDATRMYLMLDYHAPDGGAGEVVSRIFADPDGQIDEDLARFKAGLEQGGTFRRTTRIVGHDEGASQMVGTRAHHGYASTTPTGPGMSGEQCDDDVPPPELGAGGIR